MTKNTSTPFGIKTSILSLIVAILFTNFSLLFEEPDAIPDSNREFFNSSLGKRFMLTKKDDNLDKVLKLAGPPLNVAHIVNVYQGHMTEQAIILKEDNGEYTLMRKYSVGENEITFRIGVEFEEVTITGEKCQSVVIQDTDKLIHIQQRPYNRPTVVTTRWFTRDRLVVVIEVPKRKAKTRLVYRPSVQEDSRYQQVPKFTRKNNESQ